MLARGRILRAAGLGFAAVLAIRAESAGQAVTAQVEPRLVPIGGTAELTIEVDAGDLIDRIDEPALPELPSQLSVVARGREARVEMRGLDIRRSSVFRYTLKALRPGTVHIDPIAVRVGDDVHYTEPLVLLVVGEAGRAEAGRPAGGIPPIFVSARVDRQRAWTGQQVTLTFSFYHDPATPLAESPDYEPPQTPGFWRVELTDEPVMSSERIGSRTYQVQRFRYALFPLQPGVAKIGPARVRIVQPDPERWWEPGRPRVLATDPLTIAVDPLPPGAPPGFGGAVGQYSLSGPAAVAPATAGSPFELALTVRGSGNPATVDAPELPDWPEIDVGAPSVETDPESDGARLGGGATFRWILVPADGGRFDLGAARFPYFDPERGAYAVDTLELGEIHVRSGPVANKEQPAREPRGPTLWEAREPRGPWPAGLARSPVYWLALAGPWLAWLALLGWSRRPRRPVRAEERRAAGILAAAGRDLAARGSEAAPAAARAVERALEVRYGVVLAGLPSREQGARLARGGAPVEVVEAAGAARSALDGVRFGGSGLARAAAELERLQEALAGAPETRIPSTAPGAALLVIAFLLTPAGLASASAQETAALAWRDANRAYRAGDLETAVRGYEALAQSHPDSRLWADLAAALWRQDRGGEALARYRTALSLAPRNGGIRRDERRLWVELGRPAESGQPARLLGVVRQDEILLALLAASWAAALLFFLARGRRPLRPMAHAAAGIAILVALAALLHAWTVERPNRAVAAAGADVLASPGGEPIATLPEGAVVEVLDRGPEGSRVKGAGIPAGWVASDRIVPLH